MKNIKPYHKLFEANTMLDSNNLNEILLEVTDLYYKCLVSTDWWSEPGRNSIRIIVYGKDEYDKSLNCNVSYIFVDEIIETLERLVDYLKSEGYNIDETSKKELDVIRNCESLDKKKKEIKITTSKYSQVTLRFDNIKNKWKVWSSIGLYFQQR